MATTVPSRINVNKNPGVITAYSDTFGNDSTSKRIASAVMPIRRFDSTFRKNGVMALMLFEDATANTTVKVGFYDLNTGSKVSSHELTQTVTSEVYTDLYQYMGAAGLCPLQMDNSALVYWHPEVSADPPNCSLMTWVRSGVTTSGGNRRTVEDQLALTTTEWVLDVSPMSKTTGLYFMVAYGKAAASVAATGYWLFSGNPADGDTITANGVVLTFKDSPVGSSQIQRHATTLATTLANAVTHMNVTLAANASINVATYAVGGSNDRLTVTYDTGGTGGNAYTLAESSSVCSVSGATLTGGTDAEPHIRQYYLTLNLTGWPESPTDADLITEFTEAWELEFDLDAWAARPDSCLAVVNTPAISGLDNRVVALLGDLTQNASHLAVEDPVICISTIGGVATYTQPTRGTGFAHGMAINQWGEVYVCGTNDIINGGNYLICRYDTRETAFGTTGARVLHGANSDANGEDVGTDGVGLGGHTEDPRQTKILNPIWTGSRLVVEDYGPSSSRLFVYDRDLNLIQKIAVSSASPTYGPRFVASRHSSTFFAENY